MTARTEVEGKAQQAEESRPVHGLARLGYVGRGVLYVLVGVLALQVAFGHQTRADPNGALATVKKQPLGGALLVVLAVAFVGYAAWRLIEGAAGHRDVRGARTRLARRAGSVIAGLAYLAIAGWTLRFLVSSPRGDQAEPLTARVMQQPGGRLLVGALGAGIVVAGLVLAVRGLRETFLDELDQQRMPGPVRTAAGALGLVGLVGRGLVVALLGAFLVRAAVTFDPDKAKGLDEALKTVAARPYGDWLLSAAALGLVCYGLWCFLEAAYRKV